MSRDEGWDRNIAFHPGSPVRPVVAEISPRDTMYEGDLAHYHSVGRSGLRCLATSLQLLGTSEISSLLDFGCGYGRVLRYLHAAFPAARLGASDVDREAVDFCARTFGAVPFYGASNPNRIDTGERFDVVWCGSVLTHVDAPAWDALLRLFAKVLTPGGTVVFTTLGPNIAGLFRAGRIDYGVPTAGLLEGFDLEEFAFEPYRGMSDYGIAVAGLPWVRRLVRSIPSLELRAYLDARWDDAQDIYACRKEGRR